jgi:stearoyl-CoA desaturase (delta-9 desaturase)
MARLPNQSGIGATSTRIDQLPSGRATPVRTVFPGGFFRKAQLKHFLLFDILPIVGTVAALVLAWFVPVSAVDIALFFALWLATGLGITVGYHRLFTHGAFVTSTPVSISLLILGSMAGRGALISWSAFHRRHHELADHDGDLHSPNGHGPGWRSRLRGFWHAQLTWMIRHDYPNTEHYVPDLIANRAILRASQRYYVWVLLGLALPTLIGGLLTWSVLGAVTALLWGGAVRMFVVAQSISVVNSIAHMAGSRHFETRGDNSRNSLLVSFFTWGEGWHNNHHAFPYSAAFGHSWLQFDPGYMLIHALERVGLAWSVKRPAPHKLGAKRRHAAGANPEFQIPNQKPSSGFRIGTSQLPE